MMILLVLVRGDKLKLRFRFMIYLIL